MGRSLEIATLPRISLVGGTGASPLGDHDKKSGPTMGEQPEESDDQGEIGSCEITSLFNITNHIIVSRRWLDLRRDILWT